MEGLFDNCSALTVPDLSSFSTGKVTDMSYMFRVCSNLTAIFVSRSWSTELVSASTLMFYSCSEMEGEYGYKPSVTNQNIADETHENIGGYLKKCDGYTTFRIRLYRSNPTQEQSRFHVTRPCFLADTAHLSTVCDRETVIYHQAYNKSRHFFSETLAFLLRICYNDLSPCRSVPKTAHSARPGDDTRGACRQAERKARELSTHNLIWIMPT